MNTMTNIPASKPTITPKQRPVQWLDFDFTIIKNHPNTEAALLAAYTHAQTHSSDPSTQLGSVLFASRGDKTFSVLGVNAPTRGMKPTEEQLQNRDVKLLLTEHAERSAIYAAAAAGLSTRGANFFVPWYACAECARAVVSAGIGRIIGHLPMFQNTPDRWQNSIRIGMQILHAGGVETCLYDGPVGTGDDTGVSIRFNGVAFHPGRSGLEIVTGV